MGKPKKTHYYTKPLVVTLPRSLGFYFGSVIFFIGVLLTALGISRLIAETLSLLTFAELFSGVVLIIIGSRAIRSSPR
jgi:threonine/homoserine/homoserine lactone efflux protein